MGDVTAQASVVTSWAPELVYQEWEPDSLLIYCFVGFCCKKKWEEAFLCAWLILGTTDIDLLFSY